MKERISLVPLILHSGSNFRFLQRALPCMVFQPIPQTVRAHFKGMSPGVFFSQESAQAISTTTSRKSKSKW